MSRKLEFEPRDIPLLPEFAGINQAEYLREIALQIANRSRIREQYYKDHAKATELDTALDQAQRATSRLLARLSGMDDLAMMMDGPDETMAAAVISLPEKHRQSGIRMLLGLRVQSKDLADIATVAEALHNLIKRYNDHTTGPNVRADILRQEFLKQAAEAWTLLTGKRAGKTKGAGPFIRFAAWLWKTGEMDPIEGDLAERLGETFQRIKISRRS